MAAEPSFGDDSARSLSRDRRAQIMPGGEEERVWSAANKRICLRDRATAGNAILRRAY